MNYSDITLKDALNKGIITIGKWDDDEWFIHEPIWKKAFYLAEEYHKKANTTFIDKTEELRNGTEKPYIEFIKKLITVLTTEVNLTGDMILTVAALYNILSLTECDKAVLTSNFSEEIVRSIEQLQTKEEETFEEQLKRIASLHSPQNFELSNIVLAAKLLEERVVDLCPFETHEEDIAHYQKLKSVVEQCSLNIYAGRGWGTSELLCEKIIDKINKNIKLSFECNKIPEDLY